MPSDASAICGSERPSVLSGTTCEVQYATKDDALAATFERLQSQSMADAVHQPFVMAAVARGVPASRVLLRHAWPASVRPICGVYGLAIGALLSGSFIVEFVTAWPGLGRLTFEALRARDVYLVAACAATGAAFLALGTMTGDLLLAAADPRVRQESAG